MADERQRRVEREAAAGDPAAAARLLLERVRNGDLSRERLELAAYAGHEAAQLALGDEKVLAPQTVYEWTRGLGRYGNAVLLSAVVGAVELASDVFHPPERRDAVGAILSAFCVWVHDPSGVNSAGVVAANEALGATRVGEEFASLIFLDDLVDITRQRSSPALLSRRIGQAIEKLAASYGEGLLVMMRVRVADHALSRKDAGP